MTIRWSQVDTFGGNTSSPATTEYRACPVCGSQRSRTVLQFDKFQFYSDSEELPKLTDVRQVQCLDCFALFMNPCYSEYGFRVLFAEAGRSYGSAVGHTHAQIEWLNARGLLRSGSRLLDAGCYDGTFLARLPDDVHKTGVDIDAPAVERGRHQFAPKSIDFIVGDFETFHCDDRLETITMFHVLEHLPRPVAVLRNLRSMAHSGTRLVVEVPILENGATNDINGFFTVQHTTHFTRVSLQNCMALAGWQILDLEEQRDYNGCRVMAMPAEPIDTPKQDSRVISLLREYFASWNLAVKAVEDQISQLRHGWKYAIWGGGAHTEFLYQTTSFFLCTSQREFAIVDSDPMKWGKSWRGIEIHSPEALRGITSSDEYLVVSSYSSQAGIADAAVALGVSRDRIVTLYSGFRVY